MVPGALGQQEAGQQEEGQEEAGQGKQAEQGEHRGRADQLLASVFI